MASRFAVGVTLVVVISGAAFAQSGPPVLNMPPVGMIPARGGGALPPGYGVTPPQMPVQSPKVTPVVQAQPSQPPVLAIPSSTQETQIVPPGTQDVSSSQGNTQTGQQAQGQRQPAQTAEERNNEHFLAALSGMMPLSAEQTARTRKEADLRGKEAVRPSVMPSPATRSISLTLRPGETVPTIRTFVNNATTLTFADRTGAPWPVLSVTMGNPTAFKVDQIGPQGTSNIIVVSPLQQFSYANNMVVTLVNNPVPVIFSLETGGRIVDFKVDVGLRTRGPNAVSEPAGFASLGPTNDTTVQAFVDGVPPQGARRLSSSRSDVEAWRISDVMYVRTSLDLVSPPPTGSMNHVSGVKVYSMMFSPVLVLYQNGTTVRANIEDRGGRP